MCTDKIAEYVLNKFVNQTSQNSKFIILELDSITPYLSVLIVRAFGLDYDQKQLTGC